MVIITTVRGRTEPEAGFQVCRFQIKLLLTVFELAIKFAFEVSGLVTLTAWDWESKVANVRGNKTRFMYLKASVFYR